MMNRRNALPDRDSPAATLSPPPLDAFVAFPASWYLFGHERELYGAPVSKRLLGRQLMAFRTASGRITVLAAHCSHLGADLGCGRVVGESIQCPFHSWKYGADGTCTHIPGTTEIPAFARQSCYPAVVRHGYVFFFNGPVALFPLPFFDGDDPAGFAAGRIFSYTSDCTWFVNAAHGYDTQHFDAVHDRRLVAPPAIDCPHPFARRNRYRAEVLGRTPLDRMLRTFAGKMVNISITNWGGTFVVITGDFDHARSRFIIATRPLENGHTQCDGIVFAPRIAFGLARSVFQPLALALRRFFTHGYLSDEANRLRGTRYSPASMIAADRDMVAFFHWAASLPQSIDARPADESAPGRAAAPSTPSLARVLSSS